jgi:hypothetical protein
MKIQLKHQTSGVFKEAKMGFSWTSLFFGCLVPLFRGDFVWAILHVIITPITFLVFWLVFPFIYNRLYIKSLLEKGYFPSNDLSKNALVAKGWVAADSGPITANTAPLPSRSESLSGETGSEIAASNAACSDLGELTSLICAAHPNVKKSWLGVDVPADKRAKLIKKIAPTMDQGAETIYFLGSFNFNNCGIVITNKYIYLKVITGFLGFLKKLQFPLSGINSIEAKSTWTHAVYGGGAYGPEFTVNGTMVGWMQMVPDEDEKLVLELIKQINSSGILLTKR